MSFELEYFLKKTSCWEFLSKTDKPIYIYGMGDGCLKILKRFERFNIACTGIFASDEFVRGHSFEGHLVRKLSEIESEYDDFVIVLAFAAGYSELIEKIKSISKRHMLLAPDVPVIDDGTLFDKEYLKRNFNSLKKVYDLLCDEQSRLVFKNVIEYKMTGDISLLSECETKPDEAYLNILKPDENEIYVDLGAYTGDTLSELLSFTNGRYERIYALEPNNRNHRKLCENTEGMPDVEIYKAAAWESDTTLVFAKGGGRMAKVSSQGVETQARSVDSILGGKRATYIKYDVEGAERQALEGAAETIKNYSPKLCIALYHRNEDMFALPLQLISINGDYKLYMRHYPYFPAWETNLFALPRKDAE